MSNNTNSILIERAADLLDELESHPAKLDVNLRQAILSGDLEQVQYWVTIAEGTLAQEHFEGGK